MAEIKTEERFELPIGLQKGDKIYRTGRMRLMTCQDIFAVNSDPEVKKYQDKNIQISDGNLNLTQVLLYEEVEIALAAVILPKLVQFDGIEITSDDIKNMYPQDVKYLVRLKAEMDAQGGETVGSFSGPFGSTA
jgi:hypothetical protein